jgi:hypothetical protein
MRLAWIACGLLKPDNVLVAKFRPPAGSPLIASPRWCTNSTDGRAAPSTCGLLGQNSELAYAGRFSGIQTTRVVWRLPGGGLLLQEPVPAHKAPAAWAQFHSEYAGDLTRLIRRGLYRCWAAWCHEALFHTWVCSNIRPAGSQPYIQPQELLPPVPLRHYHLQAGLLARLPRAYASAVRAGMAVLPEELDGGETCRFSRFFLLYGPLAGWLQDRRRP